MMKHQNMVKGVFLPGMEESSSHDYLADDRTARLMHGVGIWVLNQHPTLFSSLFLLLFLARLDEWMGREHCLESIRLEQQQQAARGVGWIRLEGIGQEKGKETTTDHHHHQRNEKLFLPIHHIGGSGLIFLFLGFPCRVYLCF